ncbi:zinc-dependent alcohol dehydrogenase family protein [Luteibacter sp.]|uniref:zinc-dependent alcohol dehydrogenase family protein n=1 Tax=Luteibacter sp. TaxID=1886636 RepID=UPI003F818870
MKAWLLNGFGLDNLVLGDTPTPTPKKGELLVKVGAVSLNFRDKAIVDGIYEPHLVPKPLIPVSDAAGTVVAVGEGATKFEVGDRVNSHLYSTWIDADPLPDAPAHCIGMPLPGGLAEYMILHEDRVARAPANMTDAEAATLPIAALTAWYALVDFANVQPGQTVLVQGTGGVSIFAVQIAKALGARVIITSSRKENLERAAALGADDLVNYRSHPKWEDEVLRLTAGKGADLVLDVAGGDGLNQSVQAARAGGAIAQIGFLTGQTANLDIMPVIFRQTTIRGIAVGTLKAFERMNVFLENHAIKPVIDTIYPFAQAREAYEHLARGAFGKVVINVA